MNTRFNTPFNALLIAAASLAVAGCSIGDQADAGITKAEVEVCEDQAGKAYVCKAKIIDGKEKQSVKLIVTFPGGPEVRYAAADVRAFDAHRARAAVEAAISSDVKDAAPGIVDVVMKAVLGVLAP